MAITVEAVYENGVLKPREPLPFKEHEKVNVTVEANHIPIWEQIIALTADIPPEEFDRLPPGGAAHIDEYLYGHPQLPE
jgi:predicted DNA-binding antitoxin AbrB/MazE fold protein